MIAKRFRLPIQSVVRRVPLATVRFDAAMLKIFSSTISYPRCGVVISKKVAPSAVRRNTLRRRVFDVFSAGAAHIPPRDYLLIMNPKINEIDWSEFSLKLDEAFATVR